MPFPLGTVGTRDSVVTDTVFSKCSWGWWCWWSLMLQVQLEWLMLGTLVPRWGMVGRRGCCFLVAGGAMDGQGVGTRS